MNMANEGNEQRKVGRDRELMPNCPMSGCGRFSTPASQHHGVRPHTSAERQKTDPKQSFEEFVLECLLH
jgi:hypothetical protein